MNKRRLQLVANDLKTLAAMPLSWEGPKFDLKGWLQAPDDLPLRDLPLTLQCGYAACAVGVACFNEKLKTAGLSFAEREPTYKDLVGWPAVQKFFGLTGTQAIWVFSEGSYGGKPINGPDGATIVAKRIEQLIANPSLHKE